MSLARDRRAPRALARRSRYVSRSQAQSPVAWAIASALRAAGDAVATAEGTTGPSTLYLTHKHALDQVANATGDWACDRATYLQPDIDWRAVRQQMQLGAGFNHMGLQPISRKWNNMLDMTQLYVWNYHGETDCVVGDLALRWLLLSAQPDWKLRWALELVLSGEAYDRTNVPLLFIESWDMLWRLPAGSWGKVLWSGWPIFAFVALVAQKLQRPGWRCDTGDLLPRLRAALDAARAGSPELPTGFASGAAGLAGCPEAQASLELLVADSLRSAGWLDLEPAPPLAAAPAASGPPPRAARAVRTSRADAEATAWTAVDRRLAAAEQLLRQWAPLRLLESPWPVWEILDRLACDGVVNVTSGPTGPSRWFWLFIPPHRQPGMDLLIGNAVRAERRPYCSGLFQEVVLGALGAARRRLLLVDVGAHVGSCVLWAATALGDQARTVAVEGCPHRLRLLRRSLAANRVPGPRVEAHLALAGEPGAPKEDKVDVPGGHLAPRLALDELLAESVDVLKVHTVEGEDAVLRGAARLFDAHGVGAVVLHSGLGPTMAAAADFLLARGFQVAVGGERVLAEDVASGALAARVARLGGLQLAARRPASRPRGAAVAAALGDARKRRGACRGHGARSEEFLL